MKSLNSKGFDYSGLIFLVLKITNNLLSRGWKSTPRGLPYTCCCFVYQVTLSHSSFYPIFLSFNLLGCLSTPSCKVRCSTASARVRHKLRPFHCTCLFDYSSVFFSIEKLHALSRELDARLILISFVEQVLWSLNCNIFPALLKAAFMIV